MSLPKIDPTNPTVAYLLFYKTFPIEMQNKFFYRGGRGSWLMGAPNTTDQEKQQFMNETIQVSRSPVGMMLLHHQRIPFSIVYPKDVITIFDLVKRHLDEWSDILTNPLRGNKKPPPAEDFVIMENFLKHITYIAEHYKQAEALKSKDHKDYISEFESIFGGAFGFSSPVSIDSDRQHSFEQMRAVTNIKDAWDMSPWSKTDGNT